jgi:hypothetical protein
VSARNGVLGIEAVDGGFTAAALPDAPAPADANGDHGAGVDLTARPSTPNTPPINTFPVVDVGFAAFEVILPATGASPRGASRVREGT